MNKKTISLTAGIFGVLFFLIAIVYVLTPANHLPSFLPGFDPTVAKHHFKHAVGALCLSLGAFALAWFQSGKKSK